MGYLVRTPAELSLLARAVNIIVGLETPVRGVVHGGPDNLPRAWEGVGTPGFTDAAFRGSTVSADMTQAAVEVLPGMEQLAGLVVQVDGVDVTLPALSEAVDALPDALLAENGAFWWDGSPLGPELP